jgi:hypothetical protein
MIRNCTIFSLFLALAAAPAAAQWGGASLFTQDGVELTVDKRVFAVFALLNAHGYDKDSVKGPAPLERPQFSSARVKVRERFRRPGPAVRGFGEVVAKNPAPVMDYVRAALTLGDAPRFAPTKGSPKLAKAMSKHLKSWWGQEGGAAAYRVASGESRATQKKLMGPLDAMLQKVTKAVRFGDEEDQLIDEVGAKGRVVVIVNDLDSHGTSFRFDMGDVTYVVTGALGAKDHVDSVTRTAAVAYANTLVRREVERLAKKDTFSGAFKRLPKGARGFLKGDAKRFTTELIGCALVQHVSAGNCGSSPAGGKVVEAELKALRDRLKASDQAKELLRAAMPKLIAPIAPPGPAAPAPAPAKPPAG